VCVLAEKVAECNNDEIHHICVLPCPFVTTTTLTPCLHCSRYGARIESQFAAKSLVKSLVDIYRSEGVAGLWKGSIPSIVKVRCVCE
jgi:hypothetical protein